MLQSQYLIPTGDYPIRVDVVASLNILSLKKSYDFTLTILEADIVIDETDSEIVDEDSEKVEEINADPEDDQEVGSAEDSFDEDQSVD